MRLVVGDCGIIAGMPLIVIARPEIFVVLGMGTVVRVWHVVKCLGGRLGWDCLAF